MQATQENIRALQRNALQDIDAQIKIRAAHESEYSLTAMIRSKLRGADVSADRRTVDLGYELSENMRQRGGGTIPSGFYVPMGMFSRGTLTSSSDAALAVAITTGRLAGNAVQAALLPDSGIFSSATILSGISGSNLELLSMDSVGSVTSSAFVSEVGSAQVVDPSLKGGTMAPLNLRFTVTVSKLALVRAGGQLEEALRREMGRSAIAAIENAVINGAGGAQPTGLLNHPDISVLIAGPNGAAPTWDHVVECEFDASSRSGTTGRKPMFLASPKLRKKLRKTQRAAGLDFILPAGGREMLGYPLSVSTQSPDTLSKGTSTDVCSALLYGDMAEVFIGFWGPVALDVFVDDVTMAQEGKVKLVCSSQVGVGVRHIQAFSCYKDLLSA